MTIKIELPADLRAAVKRCAEQDRVSEEDFVRQSVEQTVFRRHQIDRIRDRANSVTRDEFLKSLANVPDIESEKFDRV